MVYKTIITECADELLDQLVYYLAYHLKNDQAASHLLDGIAKIYDRVEENPFQFPECRDLILKSKGYREAVVTDMNYLVIFSTNLVRKKRHMCLFINYQLTVIIIVMEGKMMMTLSRKIKELRNAIDMTQNDLADELGIALKTLQRYETGQCKPDFFALSKLATFFDVSADYLLGICSYEMENKISLKKPKNRLYKRYIACRNNYTIEKDAVYYWI